MTDARHPGDCVFHAQAPYELLYLLASSVSGQLWRCKPLFVDDPVTKDIFIHVHDRCTKLHTQPAKPRII